MIKSNGKGDSRALFEGFQIAECENWVRYLNHFDVIRVVMTSDVYEETGTSFVIIIDEWDAVFRVRKEDKDGQHSALNRFDEYSTITPMQLATYTGFTEEEVRGQAKTVKIK